MKNTRRLLSSGLAAAAGLAFSATAGAQQLAIVNSEPGAFIDISTTGTALTNTGDDTLHTFISTVGNVVFPAGTVTVCSNGFMCAGNNAGAGYGNVAIPAAGLPVPVGGVAWSTGTQGYMLPWWDDLDARTNGTTNSNNVIYYQEIGGVLIVQWHNIGHFVGVAGQTVDYQVKVFGTPVNGVFAQYLYADTVFGGTYGADNGLSATIGYCNDANANGSNVQWSVNTASVAAGTILSIVPAVTGACCMPDGSCVEAQANGNCAAAGGVFAGNNVACAAANCPPGGACCKPDGSCSTRTSAACASSGGIWSGAGVTCALANCPQPPTGACCFFAGCSILTAANCTAQAGAYQGNNTVCGSCPAVPPVFFSNCNIKTGTATLSGLGGLPAGSEWSECARDETDPLTANTTAGFGGSGALRLADDFVVPAGGRNVAYVRAYAYLTGAVAPNATSANIRIWNGPPNAGGVVIFGDTTTNRLANNSFAPIYRCFNSVAPITGCTPGGAAVPDQTRHQQYLYLTVNQFLPAGTYWIDINYTGPAFSPPSVQADAIGRQCDPNNSNALQFNAAWVAMADAGQGYAPVAVNQDLFFDVLGTAATAACYPNCDHSTVNPCLNVQDFSCFLNSFANGETYANCDNSTIVPVLNVQDFSCFLNSFANGCSNC